MCPEVILSPFRDPDLPRREFYGNLEMYPGALLTLYLPHGFSVEGGVGEFANFNGSATQTHESRVYPYYIRKEGILQGFRETPEYRHYVQTHQGRLPTEDLFVHVFWCCLGENQGETSVVSMVSFYPQDRFFVNGTDYDPPQGVLQKLIPVTTGGSEQYMNVTDVGKRICRMSGVTGVRVSMPVPDKFRPLYIAEMPLTIEIFTAPHP